MSSDENRSVPGEAEDAESPCGPLRALIVPYLDGEGDRDDDARLEGHLEECPACRRVAEEHRQVGDLIGRWASRKAASLRPSPEAPEQPLSLEAAKAVLEVRQRLRRRRRRRVLASLAAAAAILLASLPALWFGLSGESEEELLIIQNLEVLEAIQEEGGELSSELVDLLLEEDVQDQEVFDPQLFEYVLEEEIADEKL